MSKDSEVYHLSEEGANLMKDVLQKAGDVLGFDMRHVNANNLSDYVQTLAECDAIWEGANIDERDQRIVLLAMMLGAWVNTHPATNATQYN